MKNLTDFLSKIKKVLDKKPGYKLEAYSFVISALNYTVSRLDRPRHVTAKELLYGIKEYGLDQFGPMTKTVFEHWGIKSTMDFGNIVFDLIKVGLFGKTEKDDIADFCDIYDFEETFEKNYRCNLIKQAKDIIF